VTVTAATDEALLADLIGRFDYDRVARQIVGSYLPTIPGYARMPEGVLMGQVLQVTRHNLELFTQCMLEDRDPNPAELVALRASAMQRGREGVPLQDMLHGYRLGARFGWRSLVAGARTADENRVLLTAADRLMRYIDSVSTAVAQAYLDEREHLVSEQERWARALMDGILDGAAPLAHLRQLAESLGMTVLDQYRPFALSVPGASAREHARMAVELRDRGILALTEGDRVAGLVPPDLDTTCMARQRAVVAVAEPADRRDLAGGLQFVRLQVQTARSMGRQGAVTVADLLPELLLARSPQLAAALRARVLGPLEDYASKRSPELLDTLEAFVGCSLDRRRTAERLSIHANTLDYRLRRIEQLTGLTLADPEHLTIAVLALKTRRLGVHPAD